MSETDIDKLFNFQNGMRASVNGKTIGSYSLAGSTNAITNMRGCVPKMKPQNTQQNNSSQQAANIAPTKQPAKEELIDLFDQYILIDSRTWIFNRYDTGSANDFVVKETDRKGAPATVRVFYTYNGGRRGHVDVLIIDGQPDCMRRASFCPLTARAKSLRCAAEHPTLATTGDDHDHSSRRQNPRRDPDASNQRRPEQG